MTSHERWQDSFPLYAVGACSQGDAAAVERHVSGCPSCRDDLDQLNEVAAQVALALDPVPPSASLRKRLQRDLQRDPKVETRQAHLSVPLWNKWSRLQAAAVVCLAMLLGLAWIRNRDLRGKNAIAVAQLRDAENSLQRSNALLDTLNATDSLRITLTSAGQHPQSQLKTIYSRRRDTLILVANNLPLLPEDKTYELWLVPVGGGAPLPTGLFRPDDRGSATLLTSPVGADPTPKAFAVTLEKRSGATTPTLPILFAGSA